MLKPEAIDSKLIVNTIEGESFMETVCEASAEVVRLLRRHCGPYAEYAILTGNMGSAGEVDEYTRDGIGLFKRLVTDNCAVNYLMRSVRYIGDRVDSACHDGTTTSMLFSASLIHHLTTLCVNNTGLTANKPLLAKTISWIIGELIERLGRYTITVDDLIKLAKLRSPERAMQLRRALCYQQAMVSTKGDREISLAVADAMSSIPKELFGLYTFKQSSVELDERVRVEVQDYDIEIMSNPLIRGMENACLGTETHLDNAHVIYAQHAIVVDSPEEGALCALLTPDSPEREWYGLDVEDSGDTKYITAPVVLFAPQIGSSPKLVQAITTWNRLHPEKKVHVMSIQTPQLLTKMYASGMAAMSGRKSVGDTIDNMVDAITTPTLRVVQRGSMARIYNTYQKDKGAFHPYYTNPDLNPYYTTIIGAMKELIENSKSKHLANNIESNMTDIVMLYRMMVSQRLADVRVCGTLHDLLANRTVVEDAAGAVTSMLQDGMVLSGYHRMAFELHAMAGSCATDAHGNEALKIRVIAEFISAVETVLTSTYRTDVRSLNATKPMGKFTCAIVDTDFSFDPNVPEETRIQVNHLTANTIKQLIKDADSTKLLTQPVVGYYEQLKRLNELLPKIICSAVLVDTSQV